ncbi:MAG: DEAD/DEAH box helicase family protein [Pyrinomonadaceae bacterium]|nr:DEAD/DEAH box helicase family protein [Pyrinomonadaceae bacterium]
MPRRTNTIAQTPLLDVGREGRTGICVPAIEKEVKEWREQGCPNITATTKRLLQFWFKNEHRSADGQVFKYYDAQREAVETLIYLFEVKKIRRRKDLLYTYAQTHLLQFPAQDEFARYAVKMATGSGKTKVMALAMAWQYFNSAFGEGEEYANTFLLIAPNIIVLERLKLDFENGRVFQTDPILPPDFKINWDFDVYVRGDGERTQSEGSLYLTNIQQLYEREEETTARNPVEDLLGSLPPQNLQPMEKFIERIVRRGNCMVINDEAHHTNDDAIVWNETIVNLHKNLGERGLSAELDFSATPRQPDGTLFSWTIYDYPLKQAIIDNIVKRPLKGIPHGITEINSEKAHVRFEAYLVAAVERWLEYVEQLKDLKKKPLLFLMLGNTTEADEVAFWMRQKYSKHFEGDKLLIIHTKNNGEISQKDLEAARVAASEVDKDTSPINCIVSVLMLREGWDVKNVTVVAGLRAYSSKANILPEQAIGRGLRKMFRNLGDYKENVDIIGNSNFMQIVEDLEKQEGIKLDSFDYGNKKSRLKIQTIEVVEDRIKDFDIAIPVLTPRIERIKEIRQIIENLDIGKIMLSVPLSLDTNSKIVDSFTYEGRDVISNEVIIERQYNMPQAQSSGEIIAFYSQVISASLKLPAHFSTLTPKIEQLLREKIFGKEVVLDSPPVIRALNESRVLLLTEKVFLKLLRPQIVEDKTPSLYEESSLISATPPFPYSGKVCEGKKTIFNFTPCGNDFEQSFAGFLDNAPDVVSFANLGNLPTKLSIEYLDSETNLRFYEPDFVAIATNGIHWLLETKGREDLDVQFKNQRAEKWCEDVTELTGIEWRFQMIPQKTFEKMNPQNLSDLISGLTAGGVLFVDI